ncbi:MAG: glutathione peroxidase [Lachnospiraceae bacterium]|nr:glutathione peroxidase [Lachnospiraceae bacterium]
MGIYSISVQDNKGNPVSLETYRGKVLLIVNTATRCGFTPQYEELEHIYNKYHDQGFEILDFPCNQFAFQAPGSDADIDTFCKMRYQTTFPRFKKINVNGRGESPLYTYLKSQLPGRIQWNFAKFLIDREGKVVARFSPAKKPELLEHAIQAELDKPVSEES